MQNTKTFWDGTAQKYARSPVRDMVSYEYTLERTRSYLRSSDQVLEIGCGTGSTALLLAPAVAHITASDLSDRMIDIARRKASEQVVSNVQFVASGIEEPVFEPGPYDAVLAFNVIHLLNDPARAMRRIHAMVKPGGYFISKTVCKPGKGTPLKLRLILMALPLMQWFGKAPFVNFMEIAELEQHVSDAGFKIIETGNYPKAPPSRFIVAQKIG